MIHDGIYVIGMSMASGFPRWVFDVPGFSNRSGVNIQQYLRNNGANQQWRLKRVGNNIYTITNISSGLALDIPYGHPVRGVRVQQYRPNGGDNQKWRFEEIPPSPGFPLRYKIFNVASKLALDIPFGRYGSGIPVQQYTPNNGWNQTFQLDERLDRIP